MSEWRLFHMHDNTHLIGEIAEGGQNDPLRIILDRSCVVRWWGTTRGRGQLAMTGPTTSTKVDQEPPGGEIVMLHVMRSIRITPEAAQKWAELIDSGRESPGA